MVVTVELGEVLLAILEQKTTTPGGLEGSFPGNSAGSSYSTRHTSEYATSAGIRENHTSSDAHRVEGQG